LSQSTSPRRRQAALAGSVGDARGADVDDGHAGLDHVGGDKAGLPEGGDDDVGLAGDSLQVACRAVTHGDGRIAGIVLLHHQGCDRLADDVAAAEDHTAGSARRDVIAREQLHDARRGGRQIARQTYRHAADIDGVETVDILAIVNCLDDTLFRDVGRQRELDYKAVDSVVGIEPGDSLQKFVLGDIVLHAYQRRGEATLLASLDLVSHIGLAATVMTHKDGSQMGRAQALSLHFFYFSRDFTLDGVGNLLSVNYFHL